MEGKEAVDAAIANFDVVNVFDFADIGRQTFFCRRRTATTIDDGSIGLVQIGWIGVAGTETEEGAVGVALLTVNQLALVRVFDTDGIINLDDFQCIVI